MPTKNIVLTDHHVSLIEKLVRSGRYQNASEVLREGLRLIEERDREQAAKLKALRDAVQVGIDDIEQGRFKHFKSVREMTDYLREVGEKVIRETERSEEVRRALGGPSNGNRRARL